MASILDQIMELEAKKQQLLSQAKNEALKAAEKAVADLNNLGFNYRLVEGGTSTRTTSEPRGRRGGVADNVLETIKKSPEGLTRAQVLDALSATDVKAQQSISNALSNLKKKGQLTADGGVYRAA